MHNALFVQHCTTILDMHITLGHVKADDINIGTLIEGLSKLQYD